MVASLNERNLSISKTTNRTLMRFYQTTNMAGLIEKPLLTYCGRDKMAAVSQTALSNAFSWMKMLEFRLKFHWSVFPKFQLTIFQHWFRYWLGAGQATSHYLNQWWLIYWRIYASLGLNELIVGRNCSLRSKQLCISTVNVWTTSLPAWAKSRWRLRTSSGSPELLPVHMHPL